MCCVCLCDCAAVHPRRDSRGEHVRAQPQQQGGEEDQGVHPAGRGRGAVPERPVPQHRRQHRDAVSTTLCLCVPSGAFLNQRKYKQIYKEDPANHRQYHQYDF